jgi:hypothetical protein
MVLNEVKWRVFAESWGLTDAKPRDGALTSLVSCRRPRRRARQRLAMCPRGPPCSRMRPGALGGSPAAGWEGRGGVRFVLRWGAVRAVRGSAAVPGVEGLALFVDLVRPLPGARLLEVEAPLEAVERGELAGGRGGGFE